MSDGRPLFTPDDSRRLIQLQTRRAMAERERKRNEVAAASDPGDEGPKKTPSKWRLIPEHLKLHTWQQACLEKWTPLGRGTVKVATGGGKTLFALAAAQAIQNARDKELRLVIVVPTIPLMHQWFDDVRASNIPESRIGLMGGGRDVPDARTVRVLICVINTARERLPAFVARGGWAKHMMLVVDECHRASAEQGRRIFEANPAFTLGLSATPEQETGDETLPSDEAYANGVVGQAVGPIIFEFSLRESLEAGLLTPFEVWHIGLPLNSGEVSEHARLSREITDLRKALQSAYGRARSRQGFIAWCQTQASRGGQHADTAERFIGLSNRRKDLLYRATSRGGAILALLDDAMRDPDSRAIVFHERIAEIESVYLAAEELGLPAVLEHSELPDSLRAEAINAFRRGNARIVVSAKSLVEGFNVPSADVGIIAASSGSVRQRIQSLGRMLRRKDGDRTALIYVLYVADTEDEAIYEKADWEAVVGARRNRYFRWRPVEGGSWRDGLTEEEKPPRAYRPPSAEVDISMLRTGDPYPGQTQGLELRVDESGNLRDEAGQLISASAELVESIVRTSPFRRARLTSAGHLLARADAGSGTTPDWRFLGLLPFPPATVSLGAVETFELKTVSGRQEIARRAGRSIKFARSDAGAEAARARSQLLKWVADMGKPDVRQIHWDGSSKYWVEVSGQQIEFPEPLPALEFQS